MSNTIATHRGWRRAAAMCLVATALISTSFSGNSGAAASPDADPSVIRDWNATAVATIVLDAGKANAEAFLWYGFVQAAVYNAVVGITREYELYQWNVRGPRAASPEAAAAVAAHDVLLHYFPASQARLDTALETSLAGVTDGPAEQQGVKYGQRAAARLIELRVNDGRNAPITFDTPLAPGVWRPAPPTFTPFFDPWLSQVRPMLLSSPSQFRPAPQPALTSEEYATDFQEVKKLGAKDSATREPLQTETALFFSDIGVGPLQGALRDLAFRHNMDISDSARLFAAADMSLADSVIAIWDSKFHYGFWRPIHAIQLADTDGNEATIEDPAWEPFIPTPPYPDYASGLSAVVATVSQTVSRLIGGGQVDLYITSIAAGPPGSPLTRHYESAAAFTQDVIDARVWSGIHFRFADVAGANVGTQVGDWALDHYFKPT